MERKERTDKDESVAARAERERAEE